MLEPEPGESEHRPEILSLDDVVPSRDLRMENEQDQGWAGLDHVQERIELEQIQGRVELEQVQGQVNLDQIQGRRVGYNQDQSRNEDEQDLGRVEQEQNQGRVELEQDPGRVGFDHGQRRIEDEQDLEQVEDEVDGLNLYHDEEWIKVDDSPFEVLKDLHGTTVNHQYTAQERNILQSYNSEDYFPPDSRVYLDWLEGQPAYREWDRWVMMGIIGFIVGVTGFLLHQVIDLIADTKWSYAKTLLEHGHINYGAAWIWVTGYSLIFLTGSTCLVVFLRPSAAGSGLPELIGFLNGTMIRHIFNFKTFLVKFISCALAVGSGMPIGPEGPMIHMGSMVGAGISQFQSKTLGISIPFFTRFRNTEDRRNFITAGAAAGISSAFGAPVGGLLFAMEEVSSFWNMKMSWQIFFCSMVSAFTTDLFNSAFSGFKYTGGFGQFTTKRYIIFQIENGIDMNILAIIPSIILGVLGGLLGSLFISLNLQIAKIRRRVQAKIPNPRYLQLMKIAEPVLILLLTCLLSVFIPAMFPCTQMNCLLDQTVTDNSGETVCLPARVGNIANLGVTKPNVEHYTCPWEQIDLGNGTQLINGSYNEAATLFFVTGEKAIQHLFSRNTHLEFGYSALIVFLIIYFFLACWASGTHISCGIVVPMLLIGGLYGRLLGRITVDIFGVRTDTWDWMDPGAFALLGAVSFFAGVSRLTISLAVIMVEITNDIQFLLLIITTIMFAKWVGDFFTHSIYHSQLELRCIPFLDHTPVYKENGKPVHLENFSAKHVMKHPVHCLREVENLGKIVKILRETEHGGFPIVSEQGHFLGLITRFQLMTLLCKGLTREPVLNKDGLDLKVKFSEFNQMRGHKLSDPKLSSELLNQTELVWERTSSNLDLRRFINKSALVLPERFSFQRTYLIFRTLGLRHLTLVDDENRVVGILTRKDLMGFNIDEKLGSAQKLNVVSHEK